MNLVFQPSHYISSLRILLELILGESAGRSKTRIPFTNRVRVSVLNTCRTNSETALPNVSERLVAYRFASR